MGGGRPKRRGISSRAAPARAAARRAIGRAGAALRLLPGRLNRDQAGTISIVTVFATMLLTMLLGMVMNVGRQVDGKIRMQNAADAAAYSGGVVLTRGMNTLAFSNHLLCEVFAITAFLREARDGNAESYVPRILDAWREEGGVFRQWNRFPKFSMMGRAIPVKADMEQAMVTAWCDVGREAAQQFLPLMEEILNEELIPRYERAVVEAFPTSPNRPPTKWPVAVAGRNSAAARCAPCSGGSTGSRSAAPWKPTTGPCRPSIR